MATLANIITINPQIPVRFQTTTSGSKIAAYIEIPTVGAYFIEVRVVGCKSDYAQAGSYWRETLVKVNSTGTLSMIPAATPRTVVTDNESNSAWDVDLGVDSVELRGDGAYSNVVTISVTGAAGTTVNWAIQATVMRLT